VDWSQNDDHKTTVNVYSLRAKETPTVSTPVTWDEVVKCLKKRDPELLVFTANQVLDRVSKHDDLFEPVLKLKQQLPKAKEMPEELAEQYQRFVPKVKTSREGKPTRSRRATTKTQ
jgi:bifunctional non-homologous end joining protein LigD